MEFSRQEYWSGLPFPSPEELPNPGIESWSPALQEDSLPFEPQGSQREGQICRCLLIRLNEEGRRLVCKYGVGEVGTSPAGDVERASQQSSWVA